MKAHYMIIATILPALCMAAIPVAWTNTPGMPTYALPNVPHGVPIDFSVTLKGYTPIADGADVRLWFQTNGMGKEWWSAPATHNGNVITATFGPAQDCGADRVNLFFGAPSNVFASAVLRLTPSPGFAPNSLPLPAPVLDFSTVDVRNIGALTNGWSFGIATDLSPATNYTDAALAEFARTNKVLKAGPYIPTAGGTATNKVTVTTGGPVPMVPGWARPWSSLEIGAISFGDYWGGWTFDSSGLHRHMRTPLDVTLGGAFTFPADAYETGGELALRSDIPDTSGFATTEYADSAATNAAKAVVGPVAVAATNYTDAATNALATSMAGGVSMDVTRTTDESKLLNAPSLPSARVVPDPVQSAYWPNRQRVLKLGDDETVVSADRAEANWLIVRDPTRLLFIDTMTVDGGETNYTFKTFQQYLNAVSPDTMQEIMRAYLPVEGGGTVTGDVTVAGDVTVTGTLAAPNLVRVVTADIEANGFSVSNGVLRANSGLVVSNGMCKINCARAVIGIGTPRLHVEGAGINAVHNLTFGGEWDAPQLSFYSLVTNHVRQLISGYEFINISNATEIASMPIVVPTYRMPGTSRTIVVLENNRLNVVGDSMYRATVILQCPRLGSVNTRFDVLLDFSSSVPSILLDFGSWGETPVFLSNQTDALEPTAGTPRIVHFRCLGNDRWIVTYEDLTSWMPSTNIPEEEEP